MQFNTVIYVNLYSIFLCSQEIASEYQVTNIPKFVFIKDKNQVSFPQINYISLFCNIVWKCITIL